MLLALAFTCWTIGVYALATEPEPIPFYGWMLAALLFGLSAA